MKGKTIFSNNRAPYVKDGLIDITTTYLREQRIWVPELRLQNAYGEETVDLGTVVSLGDGTEIYLNSKFRGVVHGPRGMSSSPRIEQEDIIIIPSQGHWSVKPYHLTVKYLPWGYEPELIRQDNGKKIKYPRSSLVRALKEPLKRHRAEMP